jgi:FADH2 O2-dependent halogenase
MACGLKRGFSFYHHAFGQDFSPDSNRGNELLVAASPHDAIADTHWYRPDFDHFFVREAQSLGVDYRDETTLHAPVFEGETIVLAGEREDYNFSLRTRFLVDASGPRGFLQRALNLPEAVSAMPPTQALFAHFRGVKRLSDALNMEEMPPYPVDDAALHHVFEGGWMWVLRFNNGITSAGFALHDDLANELRLSEGAPAWHRLMQRLPTVRSQFEAAQLECDFKFASRLAFRSAKIAGARWALLPSAAGFSDPLFSTGFPLTLLGISRLAQVLQNGLNAPDLPQKLDDYARKTNGELMATERLIAALYANMGDFEIFTSCALLYFAAASWSESARRLHRPHLAASFLLHDDACFGSASRALLERACNLKPDDKIAFVQDVRALLEPFDVAGLNDFSRRNWYPARAEDMLDASHKLGARREEVQALLEKSGFFAT